MSHNYKNLRLIAFLLFLVQPFAQGHPLIELSTQSKISKGEPAIFKAKMLEKGIKKIRLRYKNPDDSEFSWVDFAGHHENELSANVAASFIRGPLLYYYVVWQKEDGSVQTVFGSPSQPHHVNIDRRKGMGVVHQNSAYHQEKLAVSLVRDRFGDDDIGEQIALFSALQTDCLLSNFEKWGRPTRFMDEERIQKLGFSKLSSALSSWSVPYQGRLKLRIDGLDMNDEVDGSSEWNIDAFLLSHLSIKDDAAHLIGESEGLFGSVDVVSSRKLGMSAIAGGGWPKEYFVALKTGKSLGPFTTFWSAGLRQEPGTLHASSLLVSEYWWDTQPLLTTQVNFFATLPEGENLSRYSWNASLNFDLPFTKQLASRLSIYAGEKYVDYRLLRTGLQIANEFRVNRTHALSLHADLSFTGVLARPEDSRLVYIPCEVFGRQLGALGNCRLKSSLLLRDKFQLAHWAALSSGIEIAAASNEVINAASLFHPSLLLELAATSNWEFRVGYSKSMRWPTLLEKAQSWNRNKEDTLLSEKNRQFNLTMRLRLPTDYALVTLETNGRTGWLDNSSWADINLVLSAELAGANLVYIESYFHNGVPDSSLSSPLIVGGARVSLAWAGNAYFEFHLPNAGLNLFYQSRPILKNFVIEGRVSNEEKLCAFGSIRIFH